MQYRIARILNRMLILITLIIAVLAAGYYFVYKYAPEIRTMYLVCFGIIFVALTILYKVREAQWDKRVITKMAVAGQVAIANIKSAERVLRMRDSNFVAYWIYALQIELYDHKHKRIEKTIYEKLNIQSDEIPQGTVFVTYDEKKPEQIFIVPNMLISQLEHLKPLAEAYERDKTIKIKYLNVYYNKGIVIKTYQETVNA